MAITHLPFGNANQIVPVSPTIQRQLAQSQAQMAHIRILSEQGIDAVSHIHAYALYSMAMTLAGARVLMTAAQLNGTFTREDAEALKRMDAEYHRHISQLSQSSAHQIVEYVAAATSGQQGQSGIFDRLFGK
jgi:hypothetical protein